MKKIICLILLFLVLIPINTRAIHEVIDSRCTTSLKLSLRNEGQAVLYRLSKNMEGDDVTYTAYFYNLTENMNLYDSNEVLYNDSKIEGLKPGSRLIINIYASNRTYCEGYKISSKIINVPYYNPYFGSELCNGYESFSLCKEDANVAISEEEFIKKLNSYKESLKEDEDEIVEEEVVEEEVFSLYDFFMTYKYYLLGLILLVGIVVIIVVINNRRKNGGIL